MSRKLLDAVTRAGQHLARLNAIESLIDATRTASASGQTVSPEVADDAAFVIASILQEQRDDGSWMGSLLYTTHMLDVAKELGAERSIGIDRAIEWIYARESQPDDDADRAIRRDHVFEAAPPGVDLSALTLPGGYPIGSDADVRFSVSCLAAASLVEFGERSAQVERQIELAAELVESIARSDARFTPLLCATRLLCAAGSQHAGIAFTTIAQLQRGDGTWRGVDLFLVLDTLAYACRKAPVPGVVPMVVQTALRNAASTLFVMQQKDGGWGRQTGPNQMLAGLSALRILVQGEVSAIPI